MKETINMQGQLTLRLTDSSGRVIQEQQPKNRIVKSGRQLVAQLFAGVPGNPPTQVTQMGVGTDATPTNDDQTALLAPREPLQKISNTTYEEVEEVVVRDEEKEVVKRIRARLTTEFDFGEANGAEPLTEAAIFNDDNVMYNRVVFEPVTKTEAFKLTLLWEIVF